MFDNVPDRFVPTARPSYVFADERVDFAYNTDRFNVAAAILEAAVEEHGWGDRPLVVNHDTGETTTYAAVNERADRFAAALRTLGVEPGDRVLWRFGETADAFVTQYGLWKAGAVNVSSTLPERAREIAYFLDDTEASVLVTADHEFAEVEAAVDRADASPELVVAGEETHGHHAFEDLIADHAPIEDAHPTRPLDVSGINYTGGTTGKPKGCLHTHAMEYALALIEGGDGEGLGPDDRVLCPPPLGHTYGNGGKVIIPPAFGSTVVLAERPSPVEMLEIIERREVTLFSAAPTIVRMMLNEADVASYDLSSLQLTILAGEAIDEGTFDRWVDAAGVETAQLFGTSATLGVASAYREKERIAPKTSIGRPYNGYEVKVVDITDPSREVGRGEDGQLAVRGPGGVCYWNNEHPAMPEKTAEDLHDGWTLLDDVVRRDADGYLYFVSRLDNMIVTAGRQIAATEVEEVLAEYPGVAEVAVVGAPDDERGEVVKAFVVPDDGHDPGAGLVDDLQEYAKDAMSLYKYPREVAFLEELPKDAVGKIQRKELRER
ncbi:class I adenylate-forming enzyme family protein [Halorarius halobius]|uniref:class I adenylate-forming enzyme family protein n=1 Tax=Halorarius halobius TaxID=2962671 RepID=UPI0020CDF9AC|nr:class I adenylate-forming enzyme family protein [Halorarius halobius]